MQISFVVKHIFQRVDNVLNLISLSTIFHADLVFSFFS